ncbi:MAG: hypothetical protein V8S72_09690 [Oscillospiraceae bacterium]
MTRRPRAAEFVTADHVDAILDIALNRRAVAEPEPPSLRASRPHRPRRPAP